MHTQSKLRCTNCEWTGGWHECGQWAECDEHSCVPCKKSAHREGAIEVMVHECPMCKETAYYPMLTGEQQQKLQYEIMEAMPDNLENVENLNWVVERLERRGWMDAHMVEAIANYLSEIPTPHPTITDVIYYLMGVLPSMPEEPDEDFDWNI